MPAPPSLALTSWGCPLSTSGWPVGTAAVSPVCTPPSPVPPPPRCLAPPAALSTLAKWVRTAAPLQRDSRHFAPCKERWETWHQDPASCAAPRPPPGFLPPDRALPTLAGAPGPPPETLSFHHCPHHPVPARHPWTGAGGHSSWGSPHVPSAPQHGQQMLAWPLPAELPAAHQLLAWLKRSVLE